MSTRTTDTGASQIELSVTDTGARVDSRLLAVRLGKRHRSIYRLITTHKADFAQFGKVRFQIAPSPSGQPEKFALLNEDQSYLLLTYTSNTAEARALKIKLIQVFSEYRRAADMRQTEYLPAHHHLHDTIHVVAAGSASERHTHINFARLLNKTAGIETGQRASAPPAQQALLIVGSLMAAQALQQAKDHRAGYQRAKVALQALQGINAPLLGGGPP